MKCINLRQNMKTSIRKIAKESDIKWHPLTEILHKIFIECYEDKFVQRLSIYNHYQLIPQTIYVLCSGSKKKKVVKKRDVNDTVKNFQIVAGVFNPFFDSNYFRERSDNTVFIELEKSPNESDEDLHKQLIDFILADFFKAVTTGNMKKIGLSFAVVSKDNEHSFHEHINLLFQNLTKGKLTGENYANFLGVGRDMLYKHQK